MLVLAVARRCASNDKGVLSKEELSGIVDEAKTLLSSWKRRFDASGAPGPPSLASERPWDRRCAVRREAEEDWGRER
jgi:hypothetical protein